MRDAPLAWVDRREGTGVAFTTRHAGASMGTYASLNLGAAVGDDDAAVRANRSTVARAVGVEPEHLLLARQVHGTHVVVADGPWAADAPQADAIVTRTPGLALGVLVADCVPVLLRAPAQGIVGVAHAGRRGLAAGVVPAVLAALRGLGAGRVEAHVGPSVCARCYEVPASMRDEVAAVAPVSASVSRTGTASLDLAAGVAAQLVDGGAAVTVHPGCTAERDDLFSYRRDGVTGRFAGIAWLEAPPPGPGCDRPAPWVSRSLWLSSTAAPELAAGLAAVRERVEAACAQVGRAPGDLTTVVVTKTFPASDVRLLAALGVTEVGEAREPEASTKVDLCADLALRWHCVGRLQTNKARSVAGWAAVVHSVDSSRLAAALSRGAAGHGRTVDVLVQVSLDGDPARGGAVVADVPELADAVAGGENLRLAGVMAVAPLGADPLAAFAALADVAARVRRDHPGADVVSAGMSADLEAAVTCGATHLRVGSAVLGSRPTLQ